MLGSLDDGFWERSNASGRGSRRPWNVGKAQETWKSSTFEQRKYLMRIMLRYIVENQETIARVAVRESGKTVVDAAFRRDFGDMREVEVAQGGG